MNFPVPLPDRRKKNENSNINLSNENNINDLKSSKKYSKEENEIETTYVEKKTSFEQQNNNMAKIKLKHIEDIRQKILNFKLLS